MLEEKELKINLAQNLGFTEEDLENKNISEIIDEAFFVVTRGIWIRIFELLSPTKQKKLSDILKTNDKDLIEEFLEKELPNYKEIIQLEFEIYIEHLTSENKNHD